MWKMTKPEFGKLYRVDTQGGYILFYHSIAHINSKIFDVMLHKDYVIVIDTRNLKRIQWIKVFVPRLGKNFFILKQTFNQFLYDVDKSNESL
jgi:hypothetical protein